MEDDSHKMQSVSINLNSLKQTFLNKFIESYFEEAKKKFPLSKRLFFQYAYFTLYCCKNNFLTETLIRNFDNAKANWIERVSVQINELMTIMEIRFISDFKNSNEEEIAKSSGNWGILYEDDSRNAYGTKCYSTDQFDPDHFILMSLLTNKYYNKVEKLASKIVLFWKTI